VIDNCDHVRALDPFFRVIEQGLEELLTVDISSTCSPGGQLSDALTVSGIFIKRDFRFAAELTPQDENHELILRIRATCIPA
jgi:hypothetical protein